MPKDPAVLWYYQDYLQGTEEMTFAEQGAYARLLNKQADKGHLSAEMIQSILKKEGPKLWPKIKHKFSQDANGDFYNERMELEVQKRRSYSDKQRARINAYWDGVRNNHGSTADDTPVYTTEYSTDKPIENGNGNQESKKAGPPPRQIGVVPEMVAAFRGVFPKYHPDPEKDYAACLAIAYRIGEYNGLTTHQVVGQKAAAVVAEWAKISVFAATDKWFSKRSITDLNNEWQRLMQAYNGTSPAKQESAPVRNLIEDRTNKILNEIG